MDVPCRGGNLDRRVSSWLAASPPKDDTKTAGMKTLLIVRHAKSSWDDSTLDDHERPLNSRGKKDAPRIAQFARDEGLAPELILSSDAVRAHLTAVAVAEATGGQLLLDPRLYHATVADILALVPTVVPDEAGTVMIASSTGSPR